MPINRVTVVMPVFNGQTYIEAAIDSILSQTFQAFTLVVIDDCSSDDTPQLLQQYKDARLQVVRNASTLGIAKSLNKGLQLATTEYVARMDADDISLPTRLAVQVKYMDERPSIGLCSATAVVLSKSATRTLRPAQQISESVTPVSLLFGNEIVHPLVMFRKAVLARRQLSYPEQYDHAEDYALFCDVSMATKIAIIPEVLLHYRVHDTQVSQVHGDRQAFQMFRIAKRQLLRIGLDVNGRDLHINACFGGSVFPHPLRDCLIDHWAKRLAAANLSLINVEQTAGKEFIYTCRDRAKSLARSTLQPLSSLSRRYWIGKSFIRYALSRSYD